MANTLVLFLIFHGIPYQSYHNIADLVRTELFPDDFAKKSNNLSNYTTKYCKYLINYNFLFQLTANLRSMKWYFCFFIAMSWLHTTIRIAIFKHSWSISRSSFKIFLILLRFKEIRYGQYFVQTLCYKTRLRSKLIFCRNSRMDSWNI